MLDWCSNISSYWSPQDGCDVPWMNEQRPVTHANLLYTILHQYTRTRMEGKFILIFTVQQKKEKKEKDQVSLEI